jgi:curved DNA-binding protein CbpA
MRYFDRFKTSDGASKRYKELAKKHHPDVGGQTEVMAEINRQYEETLRRIAAAQAQGKAEKAKAYKDMPKSKKTPPRQKEGHDLSETDPQNVSVRVDYHASADDPELQSAKTDFEAATADVVRAGARLLGELAVGWLSRKTNAR